MRLTLFVCLSVNFCGCPSSFSLSKYNIFTLLLILVTLSIFVSISFHSIKITRKWKEKSNVMREAMSLDFNAFFLICLSTFFFLPSFLSFFISFFLSFFLSLYLYLSLSLPPLSRPGARGGGRLRVRCVCKSDKNIYLRLQLNTRICGEELCAHFN